MINSPQLNQYLQPIGSPVDKTTKTQNKYVPWVWGNKQGLQVKRIRASSVNFVKLRGIQSNGTLQGTLSGGTLGGTIRHVGTILLQ